MKKHLIAVTALVAGIFAVGCNSNKADQEQEQGIREIRQKIANARNPDYAVTAIRKYALEKMDNLSDQEFDIVSKQKPVIDSNYDQTQYSFSWKIEEHHFIEVLTTPEPFIPIDVMRVKRVFYP